MTCCGWAEEGSEAFGRGSLEPGGLRHLVMTGGSGKREQLEPRLGGGKAACEKEPPVMGFGWAETGRIEGRNLVGMRSLALCMVQFTVLKPASKAGFPPCHGG